ncbi:hypothetical protein [Altibacter sp.]|uniref:hypothetical protein n=1 Tax=Altibacter sp. TaxID=2024823 RepID=UPI000C8D5D0B|nr:hypothetical protein [Altibacter sp.]MAP55715.1 hypothetical protein [Altibacter sp.]|tara:strand:- start:1110 stop:1637 length:528 start_codon:yes stop_codon:yes gene_type:complete
MSKKILFIALYMLAGSILAQENEDLKYLEKVQTIDSTISTLYAVISGEKGAARDWELFRYLFASEAKLIPTGKASDGTSTVRYMTPEVYIAASQQWLLDNGFFEKEIFRVEERFGNIAHVFSTYASFYSEEDPEPFMRGINSIQLFFDGARWWVVNIYWTPETTETPIPKKYAPN